MKKGLIKSERGAAAVEFALIASLFITIIFAIIEFGVLMYDHHILTNASREGARAGVVNRATRVYNSAIIDKVNSYTQSHLVSFGPANTPRVEISPPQAVRNLAPFGTELSVTVEYDFDFLILSLVGLGQTTLTAETRMRME